LLNQVDLFLNPILVSKPRYPLKVFGVVNPRK